MSYLGQRMKYDMPERILHVVGERLGKKFFRLVRLFVVDQTQAECLLFDVDLAVLNSRNPWSLYLVLYITIKNIKEF